ncbi:MAG: protein kinase domain-containing protein [Kiritimatiellia bacterium]|jgi:hypothetical protein
MNTPLDTQASDHKADNARSGATVRLEPPAPPSAEGIEESVMIEGLLSQYSIVDKVGDGGMGVVYLARDRKLGRFVAIKRLTSAMQTVPAVRRRFLHEAKAVAALNHIHIVHVYGLGEDEDGPYIVMEYVAGPAAPTYEDRPSPALSLEQHVEASGQMSVNDAIDLLLKIGKAISYAHSRGVIHRDLKPSNILLDPQGEPKVVDFGLARLKTGEESHLTVPGEKLLSLGYGAPEQEQDASVSDERADVYGLGALLYFAITGRNPRYFREQDIPVALREVLVKALATDRERRWSTAAEFTEALAAVQSRTRIEVPTVKTTWRCKWCDTVNPFTIRYCAECGWDGGETCPECRVDSFFGVQYCSSCGADTRAYESEIGLIRRAQANFDACNFEKALAYSTRAQSFEPAGPTGRKLVKSAQELCTRCERAIARRDALRDLVAQETRAENYERAQTFILELRKLSADNGLFAVEERQIPKLIVQRDLARARRAIGDGDWRTAARLVEKILHDFDANDPEARSLLRRIRRHRVARAALSWGALVFVLFLAYVLTPAAIVAPGRSLPRGIAAVFRPVAAMQASGPLSTPLRLYASWLGVDDLGAALAAASVKPDAPPIASADDSGMPGELRTLHDDFQRQLAGLKSDQGRFAESWPAEYQRELDALAERRQAAGDYQPLMSTLAERKHFDEHQDIGDPSPNDFPELAALKQQFRLLRASSRVDYSRRLVSLGTKYQNELAALLKTFTMDNRIADAGLVNQEILRLQQDPDLIGAKAVVADYVPPGGDEPATVLPIASVTIATTPAAEELDSLRKQFESQLAGLGADFAHNLELWPQQYMLALRNILADYRAKGDYNGSIAVKNEIDRFEFYGSIRERDSVGLPDDVVALQIQFLQQYHQYQVDHAHAVVDLAERHLAVLKQKQAEYVKADDMDSAGQVEAEIRQVRARQELAEANQVLHPAPEEAIEAIDPQP